MPVNDFKAFATGEFANVLSQSEFEALETLGNGFQSGIARSEELNKVWRQASTIASIVASFMATKSGNDVLDNGDVTTLQATLLKALLNNSTSQLDGRYLKAASNLSELGNANTARGNLGLKGAAVQDVGTIAGTVAAGNDARIANAVQRGKNLSDLTDKPAALATLNGVPKTTVVNGHALSGNVNITAQDIFNGQAIPIPDAADLNTYRIPGLYYQSANVQATVGKNYPEALAGSLEIYKHAGFTQVYRIYGNSKSYVRTYYDDAWTAWARVYDTAFKPTSVEIGALPSGGTSVASIKLATARTIAGVAFDGTANIAISAGNVGAYTKTESDNKYQPKGSYTPAGQAYTKSESDARYNLKNTASKAATGWFKDASTGVITQWGTQGSAGNGSFGVTFPVAFPNACVNISATRIGTTNSPTVAISSLSRTGATIKQADGGNGGSYWIAIGY